MEDNGLEFQLPKHRCCACHLLNLVATVDLSAAGTAPVYRRLQRSLEKKCKLQLMRPVKMRWNSLFFAVERLVRIINKQGEEAITSVCSALKIPM